MKDKFAARVEIVGLAEDKEFADLSWLAQGGNGVVSRHQCLGQPGQVNDLKEIDIYLEFGGENNPRTMALPVWRAVLLFHKKRATCSRRYTVYWLGCQNMVDCIVCRARFYLPKAPNRLHTRPPPLPQFDFHVLSTVAERDAAELPHAVVQECRRAG